MDLLWFAIITTVVIFRGQFMHLRRSTTLVFALTLVGCASTPGVRTPIMPLSTSSTTSTPERVQDKSYVLGQPQEATVGSAMVRVRDYLRATERVGDFLTPTEDWYVHIPTFSKDFPKGQPLRIIGAVQDGSTKYTAAAFPAGTDFFQRDAGYAILVDEQGHLPRKLYMNGFVMSDVDTGPASVVFTAETKETTRTVPGAENYEIVYGGTSNGSIKMTYREYTPDNMARSAFFQDLSYDTSTPIIRFRNLSMKVLSANNESIRFVVESDG